MCGPGGVGKGTVVRKLVSDDPQLWLSRSWTTRTRRPADAEDAYVFVDRPTFEAAASEGRFLEHAEFLGQLYGTPVPTPGGGQDIVLEIDVQGAAQVKARFPDALVVLLLPPSREEQARRLRLRGDDEESIRRRLDASAAEELQARELADDVVINVEIDQAARDIAELVAKRRAELSAADADGAA